MPTKHPRKMVTMTPDVEEAVSNLRRHGYRASLGELVKLGAEAKLTQLDQGDRPDAKTLEMRQRFLDLSGKPGVFDLDVALAVREEAWARD